MINYADLKVKVTLRKDSNTKATVSVDFGNFIINGFKVLPSQFDNSHGDRIWLAGPAYQAGGQYHNIIFFSTEEEKGRFEDVIWDAFYAAMKDENNSVITKDIDY